MSIDHFLPWSFVTHDLIWNLHPVEKNINSKKSNFIPSIQYLEEYSSLQYLFSKFLIKKGKTGEIENYCVLFKCTKEDFSQISENKFQDLLTKFYLPQMEIASNMGFENNWYLY